MAFKHSNLAAKMILDQQKLIKQLELYTAHFPKNQKFMLTKRIRERALDVLELIIECSMSFHRKTALSSLNKTHESLRTLIWCAHELGYFAWTDSRNSNTPDGRFMCITRMIDEVGVAIGAWIKSTKESSNG